MPDVAPQLRSNPAKLLDILHAVPSHRDQPKSIVQLADLVQPGGSPEVLATVSTVVAFLELFGMLSWDTSNQFRMRSQIPDYFRHSLIWYFTHHQQLLENWDRTGTARSASSSNLLEAAPYFLKAAEERRLELSRKNQIDAGHSRHQPVSVVLVKHEEWFLHQWDNRAEQFQLIGGRQRPDETPLNAAAREFFEEAAATNLVHNRDFRLVELTAQPIHHDELSRTYGAITRYEYCVYWATFSSFEVLLPSDVEWISMTEMRAGKTANGRNVASLSRLLESNGISLESVQESLPTGLTNTPDPHGSSPSNHAAVPEWFNVAGFITGGVVLLFFMTLVAVSLFGLQVPQQSRFLAIVVLGLGTALATTFLGGTVAAKGHLAVPFAKENPIKISATGGVASLIVILILGYQLYVK